MSDWQIFVSGAMGGGAIFLLYNIFLEVRSIRRMMNDSRRISNEIRSFDD
jgi:hypothetical protein